MRPEPRERQLLIALNATADLPREAICRLAREPALWLGRHPREPGPWLAHRLGVAVGELELARRHLRRYRAVAERETARASDLGASLITRIDGSYPSPLLDLELPPPVLYCRGRLPPAPAVAIVGSRQASTYGLEVATLFAAELASRGLTVVSGFARGIDAAAHRGALVPEGGRTVAVLGSGVDVDYPRGHRRLGSRIAERGALVSEFPLGVSPRRWHFPVRNRIIAALTHGTLVVQATCRSGSLITARCTLELGREVWAVPGQIFDPRAAGPNTLIRDGALPVQHPREIVESLPLAARDRLARRPSAAPSGPQPTGLKAVIWSQLTPGEPRSPDQIAAAASRPVPEVLGALLELELDGWLERYPGPTYCARGRS